MKKWEINGKTYDAARGLQAVTLNTLLELKIEHGVSMKTLMASAQRLELITDPLDILDDLDALRTFRYIVWLARLAAGEKLTLEQANGDFGLSDLHVIGDDDEADVPDPKVTVVSVPDAVPPPLP